MSIATKTVVHVLLASWFDHAGKGGLTKFNHFTNLIALFTTLPNGGVNTGLIKFLSNPDLSHEAFKKYFKGAFVLNFLFYLLAFVGVFLFGENQLTLFFGNGGYSGGILWLILVGLGIFILLFQLLLLSVLLSRGHLKIYVFISILSGLISLWFVYFTIDEYQMHYTLLAFLLGQVVPVFVAIAYAASKQLLPHLSVVVDFSVYKAFGGFLIMSLSTVIFSKLIEFVIRVDMVNSFNLSAVDDWQSIVYISTRYKMVFTSLMTMVYYPKLTSLLNENNRLEKYVQNVFFGLLPFIVAGLCIVWFFKDFWITLLLSEKHLASSHLFSYQLIGDFFYMAVWALSLLIYARSEVKMFVFIQGMSAVLYVLFIYVLIPHYNLEGVLMAFSISNAVYFLVCFMYFRKLIFRWNHS